jgi:hypothetical protein
VAQDCGSLYITALAGLSRYKQNWSAEIGYPAIAVIAHGVHDETDVEHPLGDVFPDAQGGQWIGGSTGGFKASPPDGAGIRLSPTVRRVACPC